MHGPYTPPRAPQSSTPLPMAGRVSLFAVDDSHADLLADFFRKTWTPDASAEDVAASRRRAAEQNSSEPGVAPPTYVAVQGQQIIGYCSSLPLQLWSKGQALPAYWAKGLMVLPEFRGGPIGFHVLNALTRSQPLIAAVTVADGSKRLFGALKYRDYGAIPNLVRPTSFRLALGQVRPTRLTVKHRALRVAFHGFELMQRVGAATLGGAVADAVTAPFRRPRSSTPLRFEVAERLDGTSLDGLWDRVRANLRSAPVRDGRSLQSRYGSDGAYQCVRMERGGQLVGVAILKRPRDEGDPRLAGLRMASISDLLIDPNDADLASLLHATERQAAGLGAGAVILSVSNRRVVERAKRHGYLERSGNIHFFLRSTIPALEWPTDLGDWWLTRGDGESDASF